MLLSPLNFLCENNKLCPAGFFSPKRALMNTGKSLFFSREIS